MKGLQQKRISKESLLKNSAVIAVFTVSVLVVAFLFYTDYMIYGSFIFKRLEDNKFSKFYFLLFVLIGFLIAFELFTLFFLQNRDKLIKERELAVAINNSSREMLSETTLKGKIQIAIKVFKSILPLGNFLFMRNDGRETETIYSEIRDEIGVFDKASMGNNDRSIIEKFNYDESLYYFIINLERPLSDNEKKIYKKASEPLYKIIENAISSEITKEESTDAKKIAERYQILSRLTNELRDTFTYEETYWKLAEVAVEFFNAASASIITVSGPQKDWHFIAFKNISNDLLNLVEKRIQDSTTGESLREIKATKRLNYIADVKEDPGWFYADDSAYSWIGLPIIVNNDVIAILNISGKNTSQFKELDLDFANTFSKTINKVFQKNLLLEEFKNLSITDSLTGLYNRREFDNMIRYEVERAKRYKRPLTLLSMDLDKLKELNDTLGHLAGDIILKTFGEILRKSIRNMDIAFRVGGDEFAIILPETEEEYGFIIAERIRNTFKKSKIKLNFHPDVSIGVAEYNYEPLKRFLKKVDIALYKAKEEEKVQIASD